MQPDGPEFSSVEPATEVASAEPFSEVAAAPPQRDPFWGYTDLALMIGLLTASTAVILLVVGFIAWFNPKLQSDPTPLALPTQFVLYGFMYFCFWLVFGLKYHRPVFESLGWRHSSFNLVAAGVGGGVLAVLVSGTASLLQTPKVT